MIYYFEKDNLIKLTWKGLFPIIYKRKRKYEEPCCEVFENNYYFKKNEESVLTRKSIEVFKVEEYSEKSKVLKSLVFEEELIKDTENQYNSFLMRFKRLKERLKN